MPTSAGLVWVGRREGAAPEGPGAGDSGGGVMPTPASAPGGAPAAAAVGAPDFRAVEARVRELNALAGDGKARVVVDPSGASVLRQPDCLRVVFYANGIFVRRGPFRGYSDPGVGAFMGDILDGCVRARVWVCVRERAHGHTMFGVPRMLCLYCLRLIDCLSLRYFPWELKEEYPDGVVIEAVDKTAETFEASARARRAGFCWGRPAARRACVRTCVRARERMAPARRAGV